MGAKEPAGFSAALLLPLFSLVLGVTACDSAASTPAGVAAQAANASPTCRPTELRALFRGFQASGGSRTSAVVVATTGKAPCWLSGTPPSVTLLDDGGGPVAVRSHAVAVPPDAGPVELTPGVPLPAFGAPPSRGSAWFVMSWVNWCSEAVPAVTSLLVVLPAGGSVAAPRDAAMPAWAAGPSAPRCEDARAGSTLTIGRFQAPVAQTGG